MCSFRWLVQGTKAPQDMPSWGAFDTMPYFASQSLRLWPDAFTTMRWMTHFKTFGNTSFGIRKASPKIGKKTNPLHWHNLEHITRRFWWLLLPPQTRYAILSSHFIFCLNFKMNQWMMIEKFKIVKIIMLEAWILQSLLMLVRFNKLQYETSYLQIC